jgi:hypothetical protein
VLFLLSRLTPSPLAMQLFHVGLASLAAWLVLRYFPLPPVPKVFLVFSYLLFFEFNIISRNYALGVLSLFLFCHFFAQKRSRPLLWGICLFVLANTSIYGLILALAAGAAALVRVLATPALKKNWASAAALCLGGLGTILSAAYLRPVVDSSFDRIAKLHTTLEPGLFNSVLSVFPKSFFQLPRFIFHFWNTNVLDGILSSLPVNLVLSLLVITLAVWLIKRSRAALFFYALSTAGMLAWTYVASEGFVRHQGHFFLAFLAALWMARGPVGQSGQEESSLAKRRGGMAFFEAALTFFLAVQCVGGLFAAGMDIAYPFSQAKAMAGYIERQRYAGLPMVGEMDYLMTPVSGYLDRKIYFMRGERIGSFVRWDLNRIQNVRLPDILTRAEQYTWIKKQDCLILLNFALDPAWEEPGRLMKLRITGPAIVANETYRLYVMKFKGPNVDRQDQVNGGGGQDRAAR